MEETKDNEELHEIVLNKLIYNLIYLASRNEKENPKLINPHKREATKELRSMLPQVIFGKVYGMRLKMMSLVTAFSPSLYRKIHDVYARATGIDKIYDLE